MTVGYEEFVGINILDETTMKSLFEQFGGTYRKENAYVIPNLETPDTGNFEIGIYGQRHLYFLQHYRRVTYIIRGLCISVKILQKHYFMRRKRWITVGAELF